MQPELQFTIPELQIVYLWIVKFFLISGAILYFLFSLLVIRQISLMKQTLETPLNAPITLVGWLHLLLALFVLLIFVVLI